jgi:hypothetical protein
LYSARTIRNGNSQRYENERRLKHRCAILDLENIAGTLNMFLLIVAALSATRLLATGDLEPIDDGKLPSFLDAR